ncbi:glutamine--tRNA ligase/YqeY domain fusion protein [Bullifex porci]|uniref:glutamine--tRNA ligase/YqeY domain fusion protein n=1 Tax=Bullifex porci TaxID=2606638 RepID=UPI0023F07073|nr:glutamine--tRNA ligase/YqeY domain fusion protein [Bullifex porci]MDD7255060.1 glutamine--tRNA ligase/YqeY domain fusion protein [Bullifex porci]MDY2741533.1 glutamine--tRNA ligase/YqeY domain fusion protein [Bullifex porci]
MEEIKTTEDRPLNFIEKIIEDDLANHRLPNDTIVTRFPPEPNGYLHIGHIKSICLNFGLAEKYHGRCHLRLDDTNPAKEDMEYINSIKEDIHWLGFDWGKHEYYASDYYDQLFEIAVRLIKEGKAYVDSLSAEEMKEYRGTLTEPGKNSPDRDRPIEENLRLFMEMKEGKYPEGAYTLRAKIDMASPNINMRDPALYRIKYATHPRTGDKWCIYPMYDFTHPISDAIENITHSICTLEFEDHRPAYDWATSIDGIEHTPHQYEFARLNINYLLMSKRKLLYLVNNNFVTGWDDPRMPTISGVRRRGYSPESMKDFVARVGVAKVEGVVDYSLMEFCVREDLNKRAERLMAVLDPLEIEIDNYPDGKVEYFTAENNVEDPNSGTHEIAFSKHLYIEREDFMEVPVKGYHRLYPGNEIRLKYAYYITAQSIEKDENGNIIKVHCTYDPESRGGDTPDKRKVKGTSHWVCRDICTVAEVRQYDKLFKSECPGAQTGNYLDDLNPDSLVVIPKVYIEKEAENAKVGSYFQFIRNGYYCVDSKDSKPGKMVFNRTCTLKDSWAKQKAKMGIK